MALLHSCIASITSRKRLLRASTDLIQNGCITMIELTLSLYLIVHNIILHKFFRYLKNYSK